MNIVCLWRGHGNLNSHPVITRTSAEWPPHQKQKFKRALSLLSCAFSAAAEFDVFPGVHFTSIMTQTRSHTLLIRNTRDWLHWSYSLSHYSQRLNWWLDSWNENKPHVHDSAFYKCTWTCTMSLSWRQDFSSISLCFQILLFCKIAISWDLTLLHVCQNLHISNWNGTESLCKPLKCYIL